MKIADIRAAIKAKSDSLNIVPMTPNISTPEPIKAPQKSQSPIPATSPAPIEQPTSPPKRETKSKTSKSKSTATATASTNEDIDAIVSKYLRPNQDYAVIPNTKKPTLLKGGAEKLASVFGFSTSCSIVNRIEHFDYDKPVNSFVQYESKVIVYNREGDAVSEGYGSCNSSESKFLKQPFANRINTVLKISKKRAYVDAILTATCSSSVFTQDMEDIANFQEVTK